MIKNERQYRITKAHVENFRKALSQSPRSTASAEKGLRKLELAATKSQLDTMRQEIAEYESLRSGSRKAHRRNKKPLRR